MLNGITTRTSTPQEDAEPWPGGSAHPALAYLTSTLGMTDAGARELLKAARTAQAEAGPGTLADYPVPGGDAHLLIHYALGSRSYRFKLTTPENKAPAGADLEPGTAPGGTPVPAPPVGAGSPGTAKITVAVWHNVAFDDQGRHTAMLDGYQPGDPVVRVFAYQADPGRPAEEIAEEAFAIFNDHPGDAAGADLACAYYGRRLRSLSFPGKRLCCPGSVASAAVSCCLIAVARLAGQRSMPDLGVPQAVLNAGGRAPFVTSGGRRGSVWP